MIDRNKMNIPRNSLLAPFDMPFLRIAEVNSRHEPSHSDELIHQLRTMRIKKGWTQQTLAVLIGVHTNEIHRWENKHTLPRSDTLIAWLEVLGFKIVAPPEEPNYDI
jgi:DNA-binding XRE family transcriptional regulator